MLVVLFLWRGAIFVVLVSIVKDKIEIDRKDGEWEELESERIIRKDGLNFRW